MAIADLIQSVNATVEAARQIRSLMRKAETACGTTGAAALGAVLRNQFGADETMSARTKLLAAVQWRTLALLTDHNLGNLVSESATLDDGALTACISEQLELISGDLVLPILANVAHMAGDPRGEAEDKARRFLHSTPDFAQEALRFAVVYSRPSYRESQLRLLRRWLLSLLRLEEDNSDDRRIRETQKKLRRLAAAEFGFVAPPNPLDFLEALEWCIVAHARTVSDFCPRVASPVGRVKRIRAKTLATAIRVEVPVMQKGEVDFQAIRVRWNAYKESDCRGYFGLSMPWPYNPTDLFLALGAEAFPTDLAQDMFEVALGQTAIRDKPSWWYWAMPDHIDFLFQVAFLAFRRWDQARAQFSQRWKLKANEEWGYLALAGREALGSLMPKPTLRLAIPAWLEESSESVVQGPERVGGERQEGAILAEKALKKLREHADNIQTTTVGSRRSTEEEDEKLKMAREGFSYEEYGEAMDRIPSPSFLVDGQIHSTIPQLATRFGVHRTTIDRWVRVGEVPAPVRKRCEDGVVRQLFPDRSVARLWLRSLRNSEVADAVGLKQRAFRDQVMAYNKRHPESTKLQFRLWLLQEWRSQCDFPDVALDILLDS